jgi:hypothetical protein
MKFHKSNVKKMKRKLILLIFSPLVIIINSVLSYQSWTNLVKEQNVQDDVSGLVIKAEEYHGENTVPSNVTISVENEEKNKTGKFHRVGKTLSQKTNNSIDHRNSLSVHPKNVTEKSTSENAKANESLLRKHKRSGKIDLNYVWHISIKSISFKTQKQIPTKNFQMNRALNTLAVINLNIKGRNLNGKRRRRSPRKSIKCVKNTKNLSCHFYLRTN